MQFINKRRKKINGVEIVLMEKTEVVESPTTISPLEFTPDPIDEINEVTEDRINEIVDEKLSDFSKSISNTTSTPDQIIQQIENSPTELTTEVLFDLFANEPEDGNFLVYDSEINQLVWSQNPIVSTKIEIDSSIDTAISNVINQITNNLDPDDIKTNYVQFPFQKLKETAGIFWNDLNSGIYEGYSITVGKNDSPYGQTGYTYGNVDDLSMRFTMGGDVTKQRGWVWTSYGPPSYGTNGYQPVMSLDLDGQLTIRSGITFDLYDRSPSDENLLTISGGINNNDNYNLYPLTYNSSNSGISISDNLNASTAKFKQVQLSSNTNPIIRFYNPDGSGGFAEIEWDYDFWGAYGAFKFDQAAFFQYEISAATIYSGSVDVADLIAAGGGGSGGSTTLAGLLDVNLSSESLGDALIYNGSSWNNSLSFGDITGTSLTTTGTSNLNGQVNIENVSDIYPLNIKAIGNNNVGIQFTGDSNNSSFYYDSDNDRFVFLSKIRSVYDLSIGGNATVEESLFVEDDIVEYQDLSLETGSTIGTSNNEMFIPEDVYSVAGLGIKDFTVFYDTNKNRYHIIGIAAGTGGWSDRTRFLWATSPSLSAQSEYSLASGGSTVDGYLDSLTGYTDGQRVDVVWAPHLIQNNGKYYLFYTGVETPNNNLPDDENRQRIFVATSNDVDDWTRDNIDIHYLFDGTILPESTWGIYSGEGFDCRDPWVIQNPDNDDWYMFYGARLYSGHVNTPAYTNNPMTIAAVSSTTLTSGWTNVGWLENLYPETSWGGTAESPTVIQGADNNFYMIFSYGSGGGASNHRMFSSTSLTDLSAWEEDKSLDEFETTSYSGFSGYAGELVPHPFEDDVWMFPRLSGIPDSILWTSAVTFNGSNDIVWTSTTWYQQDYTTSSTTINFDVLGILRNHLKDDERHVSPGVVINADRIGAGTFREGGFIFPDKFTASTDVFIGDDLEIGGDIFVNPDGPDSIKSIYFHHGGSSIGAYIRYNSVQDGFDINLPTLFAGSAAVSAQTLLSRDHVYVNHQNAVGSGSVYFHDGTDVDGARLFFDTGTSQFVFSHPLSGSGGGSYGDNDVADFLTGNSLDGPFSAQNLYAEGNIHSNGNVYINYNGPDADGRLYFYDSNDSSSESLYWDDSDNRFRLTDDISVAGFITSDSNIYLNFNGADNDAFIYFYDGGSGIGQHLKWDDAAARFEFSTDLEVGGNITSGGTDLASLFGGGGGGVSEYTDVVFDNITATSVTTTGSSIHATSIEASEGITGTSGFYSTGSTIAAYNFKTSSNSAAVTYSQTVDQFQIDKDTRVTGRISGSSDIVAEDDLLANDNIYVNANGPNGNSHIYFYANGSRTGALFSYLNTDDKFELTKPLLIANVSALSAQTILSRDHIYVNHQNAVEDGAVYFHDGTNVDGASLSYSTANTRFEFSNDIYVDGNGITTGYIITDDSLYATDHLYLNYGGGSNNPSIFWRDTGDTQNSFRLYAQSTDDQLLRLHTKDFAGNNNYQLMVWDRENDRVGINEASPLFELDVAGSIRADGGTSDFPLRITSSDAAVGIRFTDASGVGDLYYNGGVNNGRFYLRDDNNLDLLKIDDTGALFSTGITVDGPISATGFVTIDRGSTANAAWLNLITDNQDNYIRMGQDGGDYGFKLQYNGTGSGNDNSLSLYAENQTGTDIETFEVKQDGTTTFKEDVNFTGEIQSGGTEISEVVGLTLTAKITSDYSVSSDITPNATNLSVTVNNGETYMFDIIIIAEGADFLSPDARIDFTVPGTSTLYWNEGGPDAGGISTKSSANRTAIELNGTTTVMHRVSGVLIADATGSFTMNFAQDSSSGNAVILKAGSSMKVTRM